MTYLTQLSATLSGETPTWRSLAHMGDAESAAGFWEASLPEPHASVTPHCYSLVQSWTLDHDERDGLSCSILERRNMAPAVSNCVQLDPMVTHHFKPDHIEKGYEAFGHQGGGVLKAGRHRSACAGVAW